MNSNLHVTDDIIYIGASDRRITLFENQYPVSEGMSYNSYLLKDDKNVLFDTIDASVEEQFMQNLSDALGDDNLDVIVISHMEPDHCHTLARVLGLHPETKIYGTKQVPTMIKQFFGLDVSERFVEIKDGDALNTGKHNLRFIAAPMVHWPEVVMTYDETEKLLFSADAFGSFGALSGNIFANQTDSVLVNSDEYRRYYANIVGKYGTQVQNVLKKASVLEIKTICPLHGTIVRDESNLSELLSVYDLWSKYLPETKSVVVFAGSIYGNTMRACEILASKLAEAGLENVKLYDISNTHSSVLVSEAFRYAGIVLAAPTLDGGLFPPMEALLNEIKAKNLKNRTFGLIENGTWAPQAAKNMTAILETMKDITILEEKVTIKSAVNDSGLTQIDAMADALVNALNYES